MDLPRVRLAQKSTDSKEYTINLVARGQSGGSDGWMGGLALAYLRKQSESAAFTLCAALAPCVFLDM